MIALLNLTDETISKLKCHIKFKKKKNCNGCGSGWNAKFVPDTIWFVNMKPICCRHDDRYKRVKTRSEKDLADKEMLDNLLLAIESIDKWYYPTKLARNRAMTYYSFVRDHGDSAFDFKLKEI